MAKPVAFKLIAGEHHRRICGSMLGGVPFHHDGEAWIVGVVEDPEAFPSAENFKTPMYVRAHTAKEAIKRYKAENS